MWVLHVVYHGLPRLCILVGSHYRAVNRFYREPAKTMVVLVVEGKAMELELSSCLGSSLLRISSPMAQTSPKALYNMVVGPKYLTIRVLRALGKKSPSKDQECIDNSFGSRLEQRRSPEPWLDPTSRSTISPKEVYRIRIETAIDVDISNVADPPEGSVIYTIAVLESRIGGSTFGILPRVCETNHKSLQSVVGSVRAEACRGCRTLGLKSCPNW